jgi:hypothetical protein
MSKSIKSIQDLRAFFRKGIPEYAGTDGEAYAENWLSKSGWKYEKVDQGKQTLSVELRKFGGKRPDFIVDPGDSSFVLIDAKYHSTDNGKVFCLTDNEIGKYRRLQEFTEQQFPNTVIDVIFMVIPKEYDGKRLVWVHLDEFDKGTQTSIKDMPATAVSLLDRQELWCDIEA